MIMKPPPPMPQENGSTTPSTAAVATAAVARGLTEATAPPVPTATGCLTRLSEAATAGAAIAPGTRAPIPRNAAISGAVMRLFTVSLPKAHLKISLTLRGRVGWGSATGESLDDRRQSLHQLIANGDVRDTELLAATLQPLDHLVDRTCQGRDGARPRQAFSRQPHLARDPPRDLLPDRHQIEIELDLIESSAGRLADPSDPFGDPRLGFAGWDAERDDVPFAGGQLEQTSLAAGDQDRRPRLLHGPR